MISLKSYLLKWSQIVEDNGLKVKIISIDVAVPQGSVLSPLLFLLFTDISENKK